jgi:hypothetical protein
MFECAVVTRECANRNSSGSNSNSSETINIKSNFDLEQVTNFSNQYNNTIANEEEMEVYDNVNDDEDGVSEDIILKQTAIKLFDLYTKLREIGC